ncbi:MAG: hypothetical protein ACRECX_01375 [Methyloceanibacter sp.]|uniref:hypothetical protein n=1 Tax=Methyloceanibacter sp. TaxID=1965321 RepID=UPI003D6D01CE
MRKLLLVVFGAWLGGMAAAFGEDLPDGTFASSAEGCTMLKTETAEELGEDFDFYTLDRSGIATYAQRCDFVQVTPRENAQWVATAMCDEGGFIYPDMFAIARKADGGLAVTRLTDVTQQQSSDAQDLPSFADDMDPVELGKEPVEVEDEGVEAEGDQPPAKPDAFNHYVPCPDVKR